MKPVLPQPCSLRCAGRAGLLAGTLVLGAGVLQGQRADPLMIAENLRAGQALLADHHDPEAMDRFESVLDSDASNAVARRGELAAATELAVAAHQAGHPEVALQVLEHARIRLPEDPKLLYELGSEALEVKRFAEASEALTLAGKLRPKDMDILYLLVQVEIEEQHLAAAEANLRAYLALNPKDAAAHFGLGHVFAMQQRVDEACAEFQRSIDLQPVQTEAYYQIGQLDLDAHQDAGAEALFRKTLARNPNHGGALTGVGIIAYRAKDYKKAEAYLTAAVKAAPDYAQAHYYRGLVLVRLGSKVEGNQELQRATELGHEQSLAPQGGSATAEAPQAP